MATVLPLYDAPPRGRTTNILYVYKKHIVSTLLKSKDIGFTSLQNESLLSFQQSPYYIIQQQYPSHTLLPTTTIHSNDVIGDSDDDDIDVNTNTNNSNNNNYNKPTTKTKYNYYTNYLNPSTTSTSSNTSIQLQIPPK